MTKGTIDQPALQVRGFTGSSSTVYDANTQIRQADLANVSGLSGLGNNYNGTTQVEQKITLMNQETQEKDLHLIQY